MSVKKMVLGVAHRGLAPVKSRKTIATFATATWVLGILGGLAVWEFDIKYF